MGILSFSLSIAWDPFSLISKLRTTAVPLVPMLYTMWYYCTL